MRVYIKVTRDKYEFPLAIADSPSELARITGDNKSTIASTLSHFRHGHYKHPQYQEVEIDEK